MPHTGKVTEQGGRFRSWMRAAGRRGVAWFFSALARALTLAVIAGTATAAWSAELTGAPDVEITGERSARITWSTDVATAGRWRYGETVERMDRSGRDEVGLVHRVEWSELTPGTRYTYAVGTARQWLSTNSFVLPGPGKPASGGDETPGVASGTTGGDIPKAPPAAKTWANPSTLADHFDRHGADFQARNAEDYARLAWEFLQRGRREGWPAKVDDDGTVRVYDRRTRSFGAYRKDGRTRTFFKPRSADYFERQPGRLVNLQNLKFP